MGQGYSFFAVIVFEASSFVPAWLKNIPVSYTHLTLPTKRIV